MTALRKLKVEVTEEFEIDFLMLFKEINNLLCSNLLLLSFVSEFDSKKRMLQILVEHWEGGNAMGFGRISISSNSQNFT